MANRYTRDGINSSRAVARLDWGAECFYRRMLNTVDDFGRFELDAKLIRSQAYPVHDNVREADILRWIAACRSVRPDMPLIVLYEVSGKQYIALTKTEAPRAKFSKYPAPPPDMVKKYGLPVSGRSCLQMKTDVPRASDSLSDSDLIKRLNRMFDRKESSHWSYLEQSTLAELLRRPEFVSELGEVERFKAQPEAFFPQSLASLLSKWTETLDRARNRKNGGKKNGGNF